MADTTNDTRQCLPYDRSVLDVLDYIFEDTTMTSAFWILTFITMLLVFAFIENVNFVVQKIPNKDRMIRILWILGIYPLFALTSLLSLYFPRSAVFCNLTATWFLASIVNKFAFLRVLGFTTRINKRKLYYALGVYYFMGLIVFYFGGYEQAILKIADTQVSIFCCKKPTIKLTEWAFLRLRSCVIQFAMIRALLMFIENVLFVNGTYSPSKMTTENGSIIIYAMVLTSGGIFSASLYIVHNASKPLLKGFYLSTKFLILFAGFLISDVQMVVIGLLTTNGIMPCVSLCDSANRANCWYSFFQIIESAIMYPIVMMFFRTRKGNVVSLVDMVKKTTPRWKKPLLKKGPSARSLYNSYTNM